MAYSQNIQILNTTSYAPSTFTTLGIPFPSGELFSGQALVVDGATSQRENVQWEPQGGLWGDNSVKFARATFPVTMGANTEISARVQKSATRGASAAFSSPIQADIDATRFRLEFTWRTFYTPIQRITGWSPVTISTPIGPIQGTRVTFSGFNLRDPDLNSPIRESNLGYYIGDGRDNYVVRNQGFFFVQLVLANGVGSGGYSGTLRAVKSGFNSIDIYAYDANYQAGGIPGPPNLNDQNFISIGIWHPQDVYQNGGINLDLSAATLIEEVSGANEIYSHYKRYRLFRRGDHIQIPAPVWAEVVFNKYKNSDTIDFWFSWGLTYAQNTTNNLVRLDSGGDSYPGPGTYPDRTYYFNGQVKLIISSTNTSRQIPRVGFCDPEFQMISGPTVNGGVTTCVLRDSNLPNFQKTAGGVTERICLDNLANGSTLGYKGKIVYTSSLTQSNNFSLNGKWLLSLADWQGFMPPFYQRLNLPPQFNGNLTTARAALKSYIDGIEGSYYQRQPYQINGRLVFMNNTRPSGVGGQGIVFNALPGYWLLPTQYPYPLRLMDIACRIEMVRPIWRLTSSGSFIRYLDYVHPTNNQYWYFTVAGMFKDNSWGWLGLFPQTQFSNGAGPAPRLMGGYEPRVGARPLDHIFAIAPDSAYVGGIVEDQGEPIIGYESSHFNPDYPLLMGLLTMDYLIIRYCQALEVHSWSEGWSGTNGGTRGGVDPGGARTHTRRYTRTLWSAVRLLELLGNSEYKTEVLARVRRIQSGYVGGYPGLPGHYGYVVDSLYGEKQYEHYIYPYEVGSEPPNDSGLTQEWANEPWMEWMGAPHLWGTRNVLLTYTGTSNEAAILKKVVTDLTATCFMHYFHHTDDYTTITFGPFASTTRVGSGNHEGIMTPTENLAIPGDVLEDINNTSVQGTVLNVSRIDQTDYGSDSNNFSCEYQITIKDRTAGTILQGRTLRNRRTGSVLRITRGDSPAISKDYNSYRIVYVATTTPRFAEDVASRPANWPGGGLYPHYWTGLSLDDTYGTRSDYVWASTDITPFKTGNYIKKYTSGALRHGYQAGSTHYWGIGAVPISIALAAENQFGSSNSQIAVMARAAYDQYLNTDLPSLSAIWEHDIYNNIMVHAVDTTINNIYYNVSPLNLGLTPPSGSGHANGIVSISKTFSGTTINLGGAIYNPTVRQGTGRSIQVSPLLSLARLHSPSVRVGTTGLVVAQTLDLSISKYNPSVIISQDDSSLILDTLYLNVNLYDPEVIYRSVYSGLYSGSSPLELSMPIYDPGVFNYDNPPSGLVFYKRRIKLLVSGYDTYQDFSGIPGSYGDPRNNGLDREYGREEMFNKDFGTYYSSDELVDQLGFPEGQTDIVPGHKHGYWANMPYDNFKQFGYLFYDGVTVLPPEPTEATELDE